MTTDYKNSVFLPRTDFPMRAELPQREPAILARWEKDGLFAQQRARAKGRPKFILHDGPPYANGAIHIGHALNKLLKDIVGRSHYALGFDTNYVPGWDCHGLPIEWKIEERYRAAGKDKDQVPVAEFRRECREFAAHWIDVQREEFKRLGVLGDWNQPYTTMAFAAEAQIAREIGKFLMNGMLYKGLRPVMWSVVEKTALAEAEIEYHDKKSPAIYVAFPIVSSPRKELEGARAVIWTTTPWTLPGNRGIACGPEIDYVVIEVTGVTAEAHLSVGDKLLVAKELAAQLTADCGIDSFKPVAALKGSDLEGTICAHPWRGQGYDFDVPMLPGDHVTTDQGTGLVHTAPGHGVEDFQVGKQFKLELPQTVGEDGKFYDHVPLVAGKHVYKVEDEICALLEAAGALLSRRTITHSYPHSWRSKAPLIFRTTPQWFIAMDGGLRSVALQEIDKVRFVPEQGRNRLRSMVETRPDWCISRQRIWGVPIPVFVNKKTGEPLRDQAVMDRIVAAFEQEGAEAWFTRDAQEFLGPDHRLADYEQVNDIVDVWFDSGSTHAFVLEPRRDQDLSWPADLYLEGSDQHRGWFQSSLLEACGTRGRAPFKAVLTHGFLLDEKGQKMSKSLGNTVTPQAVMKDYGADILRIWVAASDYSDDMRIGPEIIKHHADSYRRIRNTFRYLLGALDGFTAAERVAFQDMPELEKWVLHRVAEIDQTIRQAYRDFAFHRVFAELNQFCTVDLSAFYFDIRKDSLYCDRPDASRRRAARTVFDILFDCLTIWLAPIISFTTEEAWRYRHGDQADSVHLRLFPDIPAEWRNDKLGEHWAALRDIRRVVTGALERARAEKTIGSSLQAKPILYVDEARRALTQDVDWAEIAITSGVQISTQPSPQGAFRLPDMDGVAAVVALADGEKCARCWRVLPEVGQDENHPTLCGRCSDAVSEWTVAA